MQARGRKPRRIVQRAVQLLSGCVVRRIESQLRVGRKARGFKMVIVMDMSTGDRLDELGEYGDEVLNANWLPRPELQLEMQSVPAQRPERRDPPSDIEGFLHRMYLSQE